MSNIAGKAYAMNVVTPIRKRLTWLNKIIFWVGGTKFFKSGRAGLQTLSLIHYARWTIVNKFPRLSEEQPREDLNYNYMFFSAILMEVGNNTLIPFLRPFPTAWTFSGLKIFVTPIPFLSRHFIITLPIIKCGLIIIIMPIRSLPLTTSNQAKK